LSQLGGSDKAAQAAVTGRSDDQKVGLASGVPRAATRMDRDDAGRSGAEAGGLDHLYSVKFISLDGCSCETCEAEKLTFKIHQPSTSACDGDSDL
jgi:hypothetical protein